MNLKAQHVPENLYCESPKLKSFNSWKVEHKLLTEEDITAFLEEIVVSKNDNQDHLRSSINSLLEQKLEQITEDLYEKYQEAQTTIRILQNNNKTLTQNLASYQDCANEADAKFEEDINSKNKSTLLAIDQANNYAKKNIESIKQDHELVRTKLEDEIEKLKKENSDLKSLNAKLEQDKKSIKNSETKEEYVSNQDEITKLQKQVKLLEDNKKELLAQIQDFHFFIQEHLQHNLYNVSPEPRDSISSPSPTKNFLSPAIHQPLNYDKPKRNNSSSELCKIQNSKNNSDRSIRYSFKDFQGYINVLYSQELNGSLKQNCDNHIETITNLNSDIKKHEKTINIYNAVATAILFSATTLLMMFVGAAPLAFLLHTFTILNPVLNAAIITIPTFMISGFVGYKFFKPKESANTHTTDIAVNPQNNI